MNDLSTLMTKLTEPELRLLCSLGRLLLGNREAKATGKGLLEFELHQGGITTRRLGVIVVDK